MSAPQQLKSVYTGRDKATVVNLLKVVSIRHKWNAAAVCRGFVVSRRIQCRDSITDYNEFYSILSHYTARVRCRHCVKLHKLIIVHIHLHINLFIYINNIYLHTGLTKSNLSLQFTLKTKKLPVSPRKTKFTLQKLSRILMPSYAMYAASHASLYSFICSVIQLLEGYQMHGTNFCPNILSPSSAYHVTVQNGC